MYETNSDMHLALLQVRTVLLGPGIPNPAKLVFNHPTWGIMPTINRLPTSIDNDNDHHKVYLER